MATLEEALALAVRKHAGQRDRAGQPYVLHPLRVMFRVRELGGSEAAQIAAVLHDVVEDCGTTLADLRALGFSDEVVAAVDAVTKRADEQGADNYLRFVARAVGHPLGRLIKRADLEDNMDVRRLEAFGEKDRVRLENYLKAYRMVLQG
jgi:(p)ppGpp synthase/HD superfamily hydrolase